MSLSHESHRWICRLFPTKMKTDLFDRHKLSHCVRCDWWFSYQSRCWSHIAWLCIATHSEEQFEAMLNWRVHWFHRNLTLYSLFYISSLLSGVVLLNSYVLHDVWVDDQRPAFFLLSQGENPSCSILRFIWSSVIIVFLSVICITTEEKYLLGTILF